MNKIMWVPMDICIERFRPHITYLDNVEGETTEVFVWGQVQTTVKSECGREAIKIGDGPWAGDEYIIKEVQYYEDVHVVGVIHSEDYS